MTAAPPNRAPTPMAAVWYGAALPVTWLVALAMLLEAPLVSEARSELRLEAAEPVAVASEELRSDDREATSELMDDEMDETADEADDAAEESELLTEEPAEAPDEVAESTVLEMELATELTGFSSVVV